jgi:hypothetical protein
LSPLRVTIVPALKSTKVGGRKTWRGSITARQRDAEGGRSGDEIVVDREEREFDPARDANLGEDAREVVLDCVFRDTELGSDVLVRVPLGDCLDDLGLTRLQFETLRRPRRRRTGLRLA